MTHSKFNVGDCVSIVNRPFEECPFTWADEMDDYLSRPAIIERVEASGSHCRYYIDIDGGQFKWCENCFSIIEMPDFKVSESEDIAEFLGVKIEEE